MGRVTLSQLLSSVVVVVAVSSAQAQEVERRGCPDLEPTAAAAEQARCWFDRHRGGEPGCGGSGREPDPCVVQAAAWCDDGDGERSDDVDLADQTLANVCLLSLVRAGRFAAASETARYVRDVFPEARACLAVATEGPRLRVVARGAPLRVSVDGHEVGQTPLEVSLGTRWWERTLEIASADRRVTRGPAELRQSFDTRTCTMRDLAVTLPERAAPRRRSPGHELRRRTGASPLGWVLAVGGAAVAVGGAVTVGVAAADAGEFDSHAPGTVWSDGLQERYDRVVPLQIAGGLALGVGVAVGVVGVLMIVSPGRVDHERRGDRALPSRSAPSVAGLRWRF